MRITCLVLALALCTTVPLAAESKKSQYEAWIEQLRAVKPGYGSTRATDRDFMLTDLIAKLDKPPAPGFFKLLSESSLVFRFARTTAFIHSRWKDITIDAFPSKTSAVKLRFWNHGLDQNGSKQCAIVELGGSEIADARWLNMDSDADMEFVFVTRTGGTGAYYYSIIIDPSHDVFTFRTFYSYGRPQIKAKDKVVQIGEDRNRPGVSESDRVPTYVDHVWKNGLKLRNQADNKRMNADQ